MHTEGDSVHVSEAEASGGSKEGVVRWVLIVGTFLAIVALSIIWITGALTRDDQPAADDVSAAAQANAEPNDEDSDVLPPSIGEGIDQQAGAQPQTTHEDGLSVVKNDTKG